MQSIRELAKAAEINTPSEYQISIAFVDYVAKVHPDLIEDLIKIDNENKCSWAEGKRKKAQGKRKGASDYFLAHPMRRRKQDKMGAIGWYWVSGLWLELKRKDGKESPEQRKFGERMKHKGYEYKCVYSIDEAIEALEEYIKK